MVGIFPQIYIIDITKTLSLNKYNKYINIINQYVNIEINCKKKQSVIAWFFLINLLKKHLDEKDIIFKKNIYSKPFLVNNKIFFNISHSANKIAIAISKKPVGIDIEKIANHKLNIAKKYFCEQEQDYIFSGKNQADIQKRFYIIWTLKESYLKLLGVGLNQKLNSFLINFYDNNKIKLISDSKTNLLYDFKFFELGNYILSYCYETQNSKYSFEFQKNKNQIEFIYLDNNI